jgi:hypothetical protein
MDNCVFDLNTFDAAFHLSTLNQRERDQLLLYVRPEEHHQVGAGHALSKFIGVNFRTTGLDAKDQWSPSFRTSESLDDVEMRFLLALTIVKGETRYVFRSLSTESSMTGYDGDERPTSRIVIYFKKEETDVGS